MGERLQGNLEEQREFAWSDKSMGGFVGRRKANAKARNWEAARHVWKTNPNSERLELRVGCEGEKGMCGTRPGSLGPTLGGLCQPRSSFRTLLPSLEKPSLISIVLHLLSPL